MTKKSLMKLMITTCDLENRDCGLDFVEILRKSARACPYRVHTWTDDPVTADAIVFINRGTPYSRDLIKDPRIKAHFHKSFIYDAADSPIPFMRGIYLSLRSSQFDSRRHRSYCYLGEANEFVSKTQSSSLTPDLLCSFMGAATSPLRKKIFRKQMFKDQPGFFIENTSSWSNWAGDLDERSRRRKHYADILARSLFVLCPRGGGPATYRLYETLEMGRVPVIIADEWVAPKGPEWNEFSLRLKEKDISHLPALLEQNKDRAREMGQAARRAWEAWFAPHLQFHRIAEIIAELSTLDQAASWELHTWPIRLAAWEMRRHLRTFARDNAVTILSKLGIDLQIASSGKGK
jgi:hypothetical protein